MSSNIDNDELNELLRCFICFDIVNNPTLCPHCSKICCRICIEQWLITKSNCPHCRNILYNNQLINARFFNDIKSIINKIQTSNKKDNNNIYNQQSQSQSYCTIHHTIQLTYYCHTCQHSICSDCVVIDNTHVNHNIVKLIEIYNQYVTQINNNIDILIKHNKSIKYIENNINNYMIKLKQNKDYLSNELINLFDKYEQSLQQQLKSKLLYILQYKTELNNEYNIYNNLINELKQTIDITKNNPNSLINTISQYNSILDDIKNKDYLNNNNNIIYNINNDINDIKYDCNLIPDYLCNTFTFKLNIDYLINNNHNNNSISIHNHSNNNNNDINNDDDIIIYSNSIEYYSYIFRLKIYTNGNGIAKNQYLSVFLELVNIIGYNDHDNDNNNNNTSTDKYNIFDYSITIHHVDKTELDITRIFSSEFSIHECWGYNRFIRLDSILNDGYLNIDNQVILTYKIRSPSYYNICKLQQNMIKSLQNNNNIQQEHINVLQHKLSNSNNANTINTLLQHSIDDNDINHSQPQQQHQRNNSMPLLLNTASSSTTTSINNNIIVVDNNNSSSSNILLLQQQQNRIHSIDTSDNSISHQRHSNSNNHHNHNDIVNYNDNNYDDDLSTGEIVINQQQNNTINIQCCDDDYNNNNINININEIDSDVDSSTGSSLSDDVIATSHDIHELMQRLQRLQDGFDIVET